MKKLMKLLWSIKSVQSILPGKPLPDRQADVIQTIYVIVKAFVGTLEVESKEGAGSELQIRLPIQKP